MMHGRAHSEAKPVWGRGAWVVRAGSCESERGEGGRPAPGPGLEDLCGLAVLSYMSDLVYILCFFFVSIYVYIFHIY